MNKLSKILASALLVTSIFATSAVADAQKGQKYYVKTMQKFTGFNGIKFAALYSQAEWKEMFADDGKKFIEVFSEKFPDMKSFLEGDLFKKVMPDVADFAIMYANDSGNVPSC